MKRNLIALGLLALIAGGIFGVPSDVIYTEGDATVRYKSGRVEEAYIGDVLNTGDSVRTGSTGFVELDQAGLSLKVNPETVFTLQEREQAGETTGVLAVVLGSIKFRFGRLTGKEPLIQTASATAGVRGTEVSVFAGADGSSLIVVDSGLVTVEAEGQAVELAAEEGVEVRPGEPPGEKFTVKRDQIDYSTWNRGKLDSMLEDPLGALERIADRMEYYIENVEEYAALEEQYAGTLAEERDRVEQVLAEQGKEAAQKHNREVVLPLVSKVNNLHLNVRYFSLAGLSLRRFVAGRLYLFLKAGSIAGSGSLVPEGFLAGYLDTLSRFEVSIVPHLNELDI